MRILWVKSDFLHPTDRGGQIRTLETLRRLNRNHEVHYVAYDNPAQPEGRERAREYSHAAYAVDRPVPSRNSPAFVRQLAGNLFSQYPLAVGRYQSVEMRRQIDSLLSRYPFDSVVCDFLSVSPNIPDLSRCVLFQHNVETMIWRRHAENARGPKRTYFELQADRMFHTEREVCRSVSHVIAVSRNDAEQMRTLFGVDHVSEVSTGVDLDFFRRPPGIRNDNDLVFVGAMDWLPNINGVRFFCAEILPLIRKERPGTRLILAGRSPVPEVRALAQSVPGITVTGTVADIRPYLWGSAVSVVPLRIGGGTRLKIYEAMAAGTPVVATSIGAEGLAVIHGKHIFLADDPQAFAGRCLELLNNPDRSRVMTESALSLVTESFSWDRVGSHFESILQGAARA